MSTPTLSVPPSANLPLAKPSVILCYNCYLGFLAFLFLFVIGVGIFFFMGPLGEDDLDGMPPALMGGIYVGMGIALLIPTFLGFFLPRKRWVWVYHLVLICIGMTGCTVVFSIPLLIFWLKPEVKEWYAYSAGT